MQPEILFLYPNYQDYLFSGFVEHYGNACIQAYLAQFGVTSDHYLSDENRSLEWHVDRLLERDPKAVGFTLFDASYYVSLLMAKLVKRRRPEVRVIGGGPSATFSYNVIYEDKQSPFDLLVAGYGERPLKALFCDGVDLAEVPSAIWRDNGKVVVNPMDPFFKDLDEVPSPYLAGTLAPELVFRVGTSTSRGCVFHCAYCNFSAMSKYRIHYHSPERVLEEMRYVVAATRDRRRGEKLTLTFLDDTFTMNRKRTTGILRTMIDEGLHEEIRFNCDTRGDSLNRELLELMREAGCYSMNFGLESASPRVLNKIKKKRCQDGTRDEYKVERDYLESIRESVRWSTELGIHTCVSVILGLPTETPEEGRQTLDFVQDLANDSYAHNYLQAYKGTEVYAEAAANGITVRRSQTELPYVTELAYDVLAQPLLKDKVTVNLSVRKNGQMKDHLTSMTAYSPRGRAEDPVDYFFFHCRPDEFSDELLESLRKQVTPRSKVYVMQWDEAQLRKLYRKMVEIELPLTGLYSPEINGTTRFYLLDRGEKTILTKAFSSEMETLPFAAHDELMAHYSEHHSQDWMGYLELETRQDLDTLGRLCDQAAETGIFSLPYNQVYYKTGIKEAWPWGGRDYRNLYQHGIRAVHVDAAGAVRLSDPGPVVGTLDEDPASWIKRMDRIVADTEEARGCATCPVSDSCSHSPVTHPFDEREYCAFRRRHPNAGDFFALYELKNRFKGGQTDYFAKEPPGAQILMLSRDRSKPVLYQPPEEVAPLAEFPSERLVGRPRFRDRKRLCLLKGSPHVVDLETYELVQITRPLAQIWEAFEAARPLDEIVACFAAEYELPAAQVLENLETALDIFEEHQLLV